jgi:hypothetical protein
MTLYVKLAADKIAIVNMLARRVNLGQGDIGSLLFEKLLSDEGAVTKYLEEITETTEYQDNQERARRYSQRESIRASKKENNGMTQCRYCEMHVQDINSHWRYCKKTPIVTKKDIR